MAWCTSGMILDISAVVTAIVVIVYLYFKYCFQYWSRRQVPYPRPVFPFGNCKESFKVTKTIGELLLEWYDEFKAKGERHVGIYFINKPFYVPISLDLVKNILAGDFQHFYDRGSYCNEETDPLSAHLFSLKGHKWKNLRNKLSPTFTSGKLKKMFQTLVNCSEDLNNCLNEPASKHEPVEIRVVLAQYTTDVIGSCAFGINCNSFTEPQNEFSRVGQKVFRVQYFTRIKMFLAFIYPQIAEYFKFRVTDREVEEFYMKLVKDTIEYREKNNVVRNDFMQLLMQLKNEGAIENEDGHVSNNADKSDITFNEIAAQAFLFFIAGYETSSTAMMFTLYELAKNKDIQEKVRDEIVNVLRKHDGKITYDSLMEMHYLERVIQESLRMHPPVMALERVCTKEYHVPDTDYVMEKGTMVLIPTMGLHYDPEYYPDPHRFDPDRFTEENKVTRSEFAFLPFGEGPRNCIGLRFGIMQSKTGICRLLMNYKFSLNGKTRQPLQLDPESFVNAVVGGIWLDVDRCSS